MTKRVGNDIGHGSNTFPPSKGIIKNRVGYAEHTFNAKVGIKIREHLKRHEVVSLEAQPPNKPDVSLNYRTNYYNTQKADLVWSTHANYNSKPAVKGMGIFYWKGNAKGKQIAEHYISLCKEAGLPIWGDGVFESTNVPKDHWTNFAITRDTKCTSLLAENGFFSNDEDFNRIFNTPDYIDLVAEISAKSILYGVGVKWISEKATTSVSNSIKKDNNVFTYLGLGDNSSDVKQMQNNLIKVGYKIVADGSFGSATEKVVKAYQKANGLEVDGFYGKATRLKLETAVKPVKPITKPVVKPVVKPIVKPTTKDSKVEIQEYAIVVNSLADHSAAQLVMMRFNAGLYERGQMEGKVAETLFVVGGDVKGLEKHADKIISLSGKDRVETMNNVAEYLKKK